MQQITYLPTYEPTDELLKLCSLDNAGEIIETWSRTRIANMFYEACFRGNYKAVSVLLDHIETIDVDHLKTAFETFIPADEDNQDDNHLKTIE